MSVFNYTVSECNVTESTVFELTTSELIISIHHILLQKLITTMSYDTEKA